MIRNFISLVVLTTILTSCSDKKCIEFTPYNFEQQLLLFDKSEFTPQELNLLHSYFEKYRIRTLENAKDIRVKDKKFALIEAKFPITTNFCDAIEAEINFQNRLKK